jgi:hypothetical protein
MMFTFTLKSFRKPCNTPTYGASQQAKLDYLLTVPQLYPTSTRVNSYRYLFQPVLVQRVEQFYCPLLTGPYL